MSGPSIQGVVIHSGFRPLFANPSYAAVHGFASVEAVVARASVLDDPVPDAVAAIRHDVDRLRAGTIQPTIRRIRHRRCDGTVIWVDRLDSLIDWHGVPAIQTIVVDVTRQVRAEREAADAAQRLGAVLGLVSDGVCLLDEDFRIVASNRKFLEMWRCADGGVAEADTLGGLIRFAAMRGDFGDVDPERMALSMVAGVQSGEAVDDEIRFVNGRVFAVRGSRRPEGGYVLVHTDITERKAVEAELVQAMAQAATTTRARSAFLATLRHEVHMPIGSILAMADLLERAGLSPEQRGMARVINDSARVLLAAVDDILDFPEIEAGTVALERSDLSLTGIAEDVADLLAQRAEEKGLDLVVSVAPELADRRFGDPARLRQVLLNLAGNAVKFTETGGVVIDVGLTADTGETSPLVRFAVRDTGIGLGPAQQAPLFQSADTAAVRRTVGHGLSIARHLVDLMGGEIGVTSRVGEGSTFWFTVPLESVPGHLDRTRIGLARVRVLLVLQVGRHEALAGALWRYLAGRNADMSFAASAADALAHLREAAGIGRLPEVVLIDAVLPDGEGVALAARMAADPALASCRPVLLASLTRAASLTEADRAGLFALVTKPVHRGRLWRAVAAAAGRSTLVDPFAEGQPTAPHFVAPSVEEAQAAGALILVAEDNPISQRVIRKQLDRLGYAAELVADGAEALRRLEKKPFGLLLTDCHMPGVDGFELTRRVRAAEAGGRLPIIAMTAEAVPNIERKCLEAGMDGYLGKPVDTARLDAVVRQWLPQAAELREPVAVEP